MATLLSTFLLLAVFVAAAKAIDPTEVFTTPMNPYTASACGECKTSDLWLDIIFAVDSSASMTRSGVFAVQSTIRKIMNILSGQGTVVRAGIVAFADEAQVAYSLTALNYEDVLSMRIPFLGGYGTNMEAAMNTSMAQFNDSPSPDTARQVIVFFSSAYREGAYESPIDLSTKFKAENGIIITVDYSGTAPDESIPILKSIASPGYQFIHNDDIINQLIDGFCDANCFCPMQTAGYTNGKGNGCSGERCTPTGGCYRAVTLPTDWRRAEMDCNDNDGHLASVHDYDQQTFLINQFAPRAQFWIGFNTFNNTWTDGSFYDYNKWYQGQPSPAGFCTYSQKHGGFNSAWYTENCRNDLLYVCSMKPCSTLNRNCRPVGVRKQRKHHY